MSFGDTTASPDRPLSTSSSALGLATMFHAGSHDCATTWAEPPLPNPRLATRAHTVSQKTKLRRAMTPPLWQGTTRYYGRGVAADVSGGRRLAPASAPYQDVPIPTGITSATLTFWLHVDSGRPVPTARLRLTWFKRPGQTLRRLRRKECRHERAAERHPGPRLMGGRFVLERGHRAPAGRRLPGPGAAVPVDVARRRRRASAPGARLPGRAYDRRGALLRGPIMTALGNQAPNVVGLVYIAAFGLDQGESIGQLLSQGPVTPALAYLFTDSRGFGWLTEEDFVQHFAADVEPTRARVMFAVQQALAGLSVHRRDGRSGLEVAAVVVPRRPVRRGDPTARRAPVRHADGRDHCRGGGEPRRHGLPPGGGGRADRTGHRAGRVPGGESLSSGGR